ncbi:MAG: hypothetical protein QW101_00015 [Ignisphaera sp.]|uniref:Uncharacterized protein n=1 Tax=Ignisphaera aggregans TaxID=334771 RepID=A0A7J3MXB9_9CREN
MKSSGYVLLKVVEDTPKNIKTRIYKVMNGTTISINNKRYRSKGLIKDIDGVALSGSLYLIPVNSIATVIDILSRKGLADFIQIINLCKCLCE